MHQVKKLIPAKCGAVVVVLALGMWDRLWRHYDGAKVWALSDRPIRWCASDPHLSQNMCDEKGERQSPRLRVLCPPMVHSLTEFLDLTPDNLRNGTPESSVE
jgi:hypothetical protein